MPTLRLKPQETAGERRRPHEGPQEGPHETTEKLNIKRDAEF